MAEARTMTTPRDGAKTETTTRLNMVEALNRAMLEEMEKNPRVIVLGEDVGVDGGVFRVTKGLLEKFGPERVFDTPLAEHEIVGAGIGLAIGGMIPICEMQFSGFMNFAYSQIQAHASRFRSRTRGERGVPMVIRAPSGGGIRALEHHSESEEAQYVCMPGITVLMPSGPRTAYRLMKAAITLGDPVVFFEPKSIYRAFREDIGSTPIEIGKAEVAQQGNDLTIVTWGAMLRKSREAAERVSKETGASIEIVDILSLLPLDVETIVKSVQKTGRCVVVHEAPRSGGYAGEIFARINEGCFYNLRAAPARVAAFDVPYPLFAREKAYLPDTERIALQLKKTLSDA